MKIPALPRLALLFLALLSFVRADDAATIATVTAADDIRIAAMIAADPTRLGDTLSDDLHYAHSNGKLDTKTSLVESLVTKQSIYTGVEYQTRDFSVAAPGIVLMKGRALVKAGSKDMINLIDLNYLAVWRLEGGQWRFLAWQSCRNVPNVPLGPPAPVVPPSNARTTNTAN
jgi:Domain of unknown function (DUF4440)